MAVSEINVELLLSRRVYALNGRVVGRLEEIRAEVRGSECVVTEYLVGVYAMFERLAAWSIGRSILRTLRVRSKGGGYRVAWDQLELSDPLRPRLCCAMSELPLIDER
jgi:sporulation protein YlmC with PRC-barrel domain